MNSKSLFLCIFLVQMMANASAQNFDFPVVDAHCHIRTHADHVPGFKSMDEYWAENSNIAIDYIFALNIANRGQLEQTRSANDSLFSLARKDKRVVPVCSVHPDDGPEALKELDRIASLGGKIIKIHPLNQGFSILTDNVFGIVKAAGEKGIVVLIDGYGFVVPDYVEHLLQLALSNPDTKFIIAHMGGSDFYKLGGFKPVIALNPGLFNNLWFDLSVTVGIYAGSPYQEQLEWVIRQIGVDRVLFGSDDPAMTLQQALQAFYTLNFTREEQEKMLSKNAIGLLDLSE